MVENNKIQLRGFHNTYDENGDADGFEFAYRTMYYKGLWLSQFRVGDVTVDGVVYPKSDLIYNIYGIDYTAEEMYDREDIYWQVNDIATIKIKKPGGLKKGYHEISVKAGWVLNYGPDQEKEADGSGLGNAGFMAEMFSREPRKLLLAR